MYSISISNPWRRLGYTRAARVVDILERRGILGQVREQVLVDLDALVRCGFKTSL